MFERYTEDARKSIFFARYQASVFGSTEITTEELLLGILQADKTTPWKLSMGEVSEIQKELEEGMRPRERIATSVDLPLSMGSKRVLEYAAEEAERLNHKHIEPLHLVLGLLRVEDSIASNILRKHGMECDPFREYVRRSLLPPAQRERGLEGPGLDDDASAAE